MAHLDLVEVLLGECKVYVCVLVSICVCVVAVSVLWQCLCLRPCKCLCLWQCLCLRPCKKVNLFVHLLVVNILIVPFLFFFFLIIIGCFEGGQISPDVQDVLGDTALSLNFTT